MFSRILLALVLVFAGCSTFTPAELAQIRQRGVRPEILNKLEHRRALEPGDIVALKRAGVPDEQVVRHLEDAGVNYVATRSDAVRLRSARVSPRVIDAFLNASERFAQKETYQPYDDGWYYGDPWASNFYGDWQVGYSVSSHRHHGGNHDHRDSGGHRRR